MKNVFSVTALSTAAIVASASAAVVVPIGSAAAQGLTQGDAGQAVDAGFAARFARASQYVKLPDLLRDSLAPPQWFADGNRFIYWAATGPNAGTWVIVDARTGQQDPVIAAADLKAQFAALAGNSAVINGNAPYEFDQSGNRILFQNAERTFAVDIGSHRLSALSPDDIAARPSIASPDGKTFLLMTPGGFSVIDRSGRTLVERKGEEGYGWQVPPEAWSPDGRYLLAMHVDERGVHKIPIVDYSPVEKVKMVPYSKTGTPLPRTEFHLIDVATGEVKPLPPVESDGYSFIAGWRPNGSEALVLYLTRDGKRLDLIGYNAATSASRLILREENQKTFVGALDFTTATYPWQVKPLDDEHFTWMSERDGWRNVYLYNWSGKLERQLTNGKYVVERVLGTAPGKKDLLVVASADGPTPYNQSLYRVPLSGGKMTRITTQPADHQISLSPNGAYYTDAYSTFTEPRRTMVGRTGDGREIQYSQADASQLFKLGYLPPEPFTALATDGSTKIYGVIFKPADFDPNKRYPVIESIYAGPFITIVPHGFVGGKQELGNGAQFLGQAMAQMGFVVVLVDSRGTPGRSKAFQDANYGRIGQIEIPDHVTAIQQAAASRPYMDLDRVGIFGHSWGGYYATRAMLTAPDFYKAGYSGAQGMLEEEAVINEPNMGLLSKNPQGYEAGSNVRLAGNLKGAFKMMHGTSDVNASVSTTMRMTEALIKADKHFELLIMPGMPHWPTPPLGRYYIEDALRFFTRNLGRPR